MIPSLPGELRIRMSMKRRLRANPDQVAFVSALPDGAGSSAFAGGDGDADGDGDSEVDGDGAGAALASLTVSIAQFRSQRSSPVLATRWQLTVTIWPGRSLVAWS